MYNLHEQYLDLASGFHVIELRTPQGQRHVVQIQLGHSACPACGAVRPQDHLGALDPAAAIAEVREALNTSQQQMLAYAARHQLEVR